MLIPTLPPPEITAALDRGERVIWSGQPRRGLVFRGADAFAIPFALFWTSVPLFSAWTMLRAPRVAPFALIGLLPFILIGLHMLVARFVIDAAQRRRTFYALTDERIMIVSGLMRRNVQSLALRTLDQVDVSARAFGEGTIAFGRSQYRSFALAGWPGTKGVQAPMFELIPDAAAVAKLIRDAQRAANAPPER